MKHPAIVFGCLLAIAVVAPSEERVPRLSAAASSRAAHETAIEVYPTGVHPTDAQNVQAAIDTVPLPGTVVMKATDATGDPAAFNFGGDGTIGSGAVVVMQRSGVTLTGEGWDDALGEPRTRIVGGGGPFRFSPTVAGVAMVFAVNAPGVTLRELKLTTTSAYTGVWVTSANQSASPEPVIIERNDFSVRNYHVLMTHTAAFPVRVDRNVFHGAVSGQWVGFTLRPIDTFPFDELVIPQGEHGQPIRYPLSLTNNRILMPSEAPIGTAVFMHGWNNTYSQDPDPDVGCRRFRTDLSAPWVYQYVQGDNGPVFITGNEILVDSPETSMEVFVLGAGGGGLSDALVRNNTVAGVAGWGLSRYPYGHRVTIADNDFSDLRAHVQMSIEAADTLVLNNRLGPQTTLPPDDELPPGIPQPSVVLLSVQYNPTNTPVPNAVARCVLARNDYRRTGIESGAVLLASQQEARWPAYGASTGHEVMHNLIFETGRFPPGTGGPRQQVFILAGELNPATGLPWVHDNWVVGQPVWGRAGSAPGPVVSAFRGATRAGALDLSYVSER